MLMLVVLSDDASIWASSRAADFARRSWISEVNFDYRHTLLVDR